MLQRRYRLDGWLGIMMGAKLYINFDGKNTFDHAFTMLLKELDGTNKNDIVPVIAAPQMNGLLAIVYSHRLLIQCSLQQLLVNLWMQWMLFR
jgi:hypothetical protein